MELHISLAAEKIAEIAGLPITNSMLTTWLVIGLLFLVSILGTRNLKLIPAGNFQQILEILVEGLFSLVESVAGTKAKVFFPVIFSFFLYIVLSNWTGLIPGVGSVGFIHQQSSDTHLESETQIPAEQPIVVNQHTDAELAADLHEDESAEHHTKFTPLFRAPSADLNFTLALALISVILIQFYGFKFRGAGKHLSTYFNFSSPIYFFVGILELVGEFAKIISFAFRLFGNVFAGEVLLAVIAFLIPYVFNIAPAPFFLLEIFVGFVQGLVFAILTLVFLTSASSSHDH